MRVDVDRVTVSLGGHDIVREASLSVPAGTVVGLVGPNGSGKSSLLRTLYRSVRPASGTVRVDGEDVLGLGDRAAARAIAVMVQDPVTDFDLSVYETVMLGRGPHHAPFGRDTRDDHDIVVEAMRRAEVTELADRMVATLSGGQRQRVMLARALAQQTPVLVLDEPSNHLDVNHQHELMSLVRELGRTVIAALHDLNLAAQYCDRIVVLDAGRVVAEGTPQGVLTVELIRDVFGVDARILATSEGPVFAFRRRAPAPHTASIPIDTESVVQP